MPSKTSSTHVKAFTVASLGVRRGYETVKLTMVDADSPRTYDAYIPVALWDLLLDACSRSVLHSEDASESQED